MRRIWLHIGLPKTGTTAAQVELYHLDDARLRYARLPPGMDHNAILDAVTRGDAAAIAQLEANLRQDDRDIILSSEALVQVPDRAGPLLALLRRHADTVIVLCGVRNLVDHVPALLVHRLPEIIDDVRRSIGTPRPWRPDTYFDQYEAVAAWMRQCTDDGFLLVDYDATMAQSPASGLLARMGRPDLRTPGFRINGSLSMEAVSVLMALIADTDLAPSQSLSLLWGRLLRGFGRRRLRLERTALDVAIEPVRTTIAMVESRLGRSLTIDTPCPDAYFVSHPEDLAIAGRQLVELFCGHLRTVWHWPVPALSTPEAMLSWLQAHLATLVELDVAPQCFDPTRYLRANPDVAASGMDAAEHYRQHGFFEQRQI